MTTFPQIADLEDRLLKAMLRSDTKELDLLIADSLIFTDHRGLLINKEADIEAHRSGTIIINTIKTSELIIKNYKDIAIVSVLMSIEGQYMGQPFKGKNRYSRVWMLIDGLWKIVAGHATSVVVN